MSEFLSCKLLKAPFSLDPTGPGPEALQASAAWHPQHLILIAETKPALFITTEIVPSLYQTQARHMKAQLLSAAWGGWRGGELPGAQGTCAKFRAGLNLLFFLGKWQKLTSSSAGADLEHTLASC